jgi:hypothetical protein
MIKTPARPRRKHAKEPRERAMNLGIYEMLFALNHNFDEILVRVDRLRDLGHFRNRFQRQSIAICQATLKETRAWFNFEILQILVDREERNLAYFGRIRHDLEKTLAAPPCSGIASRL